MSRVIHPTQNTVNIIANKNMMTPTIFADVDFSVTMPSAVKNPLRFCN